MNIVFCTVPPYLYGLDGTAVAVSERPRGAAFIAGLSGGQFFYPGEVTTLWTSSSVTAATAATAANSKHSRKGDGEVRTTTIASSLSVDGESGHLERSRRVFFTRHVRWHVFFHCYLRFCADSMTIRSSAV